jgi:hypothetical protein
MPDRSVCRRTTPSALLVAVMLTATFASGQHYNQTDLTTDTRAVSPNAPNVDPNLVNSWGLARGSSTFWWVSDNGTGRATLYNGEGVPQSLVVTIPSPDGNGTSAPTGAVFNFTNAFPIKGTKSVFLFVTEDGTIAGWNPAAGNTAPVAVNRSGKAVYKGCAIAQTRQGPRLYATNFTTGTVEEFDGSFNPVPLSPLAFRVSGLPEGFVPFNIQNVGGNLVVTFAFRQPGSEDEQHGAGLGAGHDVALARHDRSGAAGRARLVDLLVRAAVAADVPGHSCDASSRRPVLAGPRRGVRLNHPALPGHDVDRTAFWPENLISCTVRPVPRKAGWRGIKLNRNQHR